MSDTKLVLEALRAGNDDIAARILKEIMEKRTYAIIETLFGNVISLKVQSVANGGAALDNVYATPSPSKKKKKLPTLKKNVYGVGMQPANNSGDGGEGGGDGGGGGGE